MRAMHGYVESFLDRKGEVGNILAVALGTGEVCRCTEESLCRPLRHSSRMKRTPGIMKVIEVWAEVRLVRNVGTK